MQANYDQNFSLMTGWSNPFINWACINIMGPKNTTWAYIFVAWAAIPVWVPPIVDSKRFQTALDSFRTKVSSLRDSVKGR